MPNPQAPQRIAVLGGGVGSLSAVYALTSQPDWKDRYDITLYQLGWRLGGKGATGRDPQTGRVLEHGLHLWFGFYENAFAMLKGVYRELARPPTSPIPTWDKATIPHNQYSMMNWFNGAWIPWNIALPSNPSSPGDGTPFPPLWDYVIEAMQELINIWEEFDPDAQTSLDAIPLVGTVASLLAVETVQGVLSLLSQLLEKMRHGQTPDYEEDIEHILASLLSHARTLVHAHLGDAKIASDLETYRTWISFDFLSTAVIGILTEDLVTQGFSAANNVNFKDWMQKYGLSPVSQASCLIQTAYDSSFALFHYTDDPDMEAGTVLQGALRMFLLYKGSVSYEFAAGCGDSVFAPLYEVLHNRGVKFEFFHEVKEIVADPGGAQTITGIRLRQQAHVKTGEYSPLFDVNGLPCWPKEPLYDQLVEGAQLKAQGVNLESYWNTWTGGTDKTLQKGQDFDLVIAGLSFYPLTYLTPTLSARSARWQAMVGGLDTTRTQAFQLWLKPTLAEMGWTTPPPLLSTFGEPMDTWADLSAVLATENWPAAMKPQCLAYFCGAMTQGGWQFPPQSDADTPPVRRGW